MASIAVNIGDMLCTSRISKDSISSTSLGTCLNTVVQVDRSPACAAVLRKVRERKSKAVSSPPTDATRSVASLSLSSIVVWLIWGGMTLCALWYVITQASIVPRHDYWTVVPQVSGASDVTWNWLWLPHNEHRLVLPKLALVALGRTTNDIRAASLLGVVLLASVGALLIAQTARLRGSVSPADAFFPLALLHIGHATTFLWPFNLQNVLAATLSLTLVVVMVGSSSGRLSVNRLLAWGACLLLLCLTGMAGVLFVVPCAAWGLPMTWRGVRFPEETRFRAALMGSLALVGLAVATFVLLQHEGSHTSNTAADLASVLETGLQCLAISFGIGVAFPPAPPAFWMIIAGLVAVAWTASTFGVLQRWRADSPHRPRYEALLAAMAGMALVLAGIAVGRAAIGPNAGLQDRYAMILAPLSATIYLAAATVPERLCGAVRWTLFTVALLLLPLNVRVGLVQGEYTHEVLGPVEAQLGSGFPSDVLAWMHGPALWPGSDDELARRLEMLRNAGMLPDRRLTRKESADIVNSFGAALAAQGNLDAAEEQFRKALELAPGFPQAERNLQLLRQARKKAKGERTPCHE